MTFNTTKKATKTDTQNLAGHEAFSLSKETELYFAVSSTFLKDTFYESGDSRISRIINLIKECDDKFVAQLAIYNRQENNIRSATTVLLGELFKRHSPYARPATILAAQRPDDLTELFAYVGKMKKQLKRAIRRSLFKFDRYQLSKYQMGNREIKLVDLFNLVRPNPKFANEEQKTAWEELIKGTLKAPQSSMTKVLSKSSADSEERAEDLKELIKSKKIGYMALVKNLNKMENLGIDKEIYDILVDKDRVINSGLLPFRFIDAMDHVNNSTFLKGLNEAANISCQNIPQFDGKTLVALDISGSMSGKPIKIGSLIAGALATRDNVDVVTYDTSLREHKIIPGTPLMAIVNQIRADGGGTNTGVVFAHAQKKYDQIVIVSDNESWLSSAQEAYRFYSSGVRTYCIDVNGYGTTDLKGGNVFHMSGWSNSMFDFIVSGVDKALAKIRSIPVEIK